MYGTVLLIKNAYCRVGVLNKISKANKGIDHHEKNLLVKKKKFL
jgi:hypothetical protein